MQKYPYETPGSPSGNRRPRRFTGLLIIQQVAVLIVVYLAVVGLTHFRVEALAATAALATFILAFTRHVAETRAVRSESGRARTAPSAGARDPGPWGDPGPPREVTIAVSVTIACDEAR